MKIWRIDYNDDHAHIFEWFGTKKEATKRWNKILRCIEDGVDITLYKGPHIVEFPDRKDDLVIWLNAHRRFDRTQ